jgi:uncharacterized glyoxalase superfamily protein PhnB
MPGWPAMPPPADPPPGARLALVVATGTYTDPGLRRLRAPAQDAADLAQVLADPGIGGFAVTTVIDQPAQQIRLAVEDFLDGRGTGDLLLVYLSCHGLLDARRRLYFAAADTRTDRLGSTGVEAAWVLEQLEHCRARRQVLILDSCFSGAFAHGAKGEAGLSLQDRFLGQGRGRVVLTASAATEYSFEGDPTDAAVTAAGSVFTAALVQGLRTGAADTDHDGHVSVDDAYAYVFDQVQAAGAAQTPQRWLYGAEGKILLARNPAGPVIIPAPLPESLRAGLDSPHPGIRIGAVTELGEWLTGGDPARAATARRHLQEVADTDIPHVAQTARTLLGTGTAAEPPAAAVSYATAPGPPPTPIPVPPPASEATAAARPDPVPGTHAPARPGLGKRSTASLLNPYLNFNGDARQAMEFYTSVFGGNLNLVTFADFDIKDAPDADRIMHGQLETEAGYTIMAADISSNMEYRPVAGLAIALSGDDADDLRHYWEKLSASGTTTMPLQKQAWGDEFGMCVDRFGVSWLVNISHPLA